jgi:DNA polymerase III subunit epsilon
MELELQRPLVFFDIESTGLNIVSDSMIELSFVKILPGGEERIKTWRLKPWDYEKREQKPITPGAQAVHGISDEELKDCPRFCDVVEEVLDWLKDSDLAGFNSAKFDLPMLSEEIERLRYYTGSYLETHPNASAEVREKFQHILDVVKGVNLHEVKMVDVQGIYHQMEPRNLKAAYRFYCGGEDFENAHSAEADTVATYKVLKGELDRYPETLKNDVDFLANFSTKNKTIDYAGRLAWNDAKEAVITFGKHKGKTAREVYASEPSYFAWIKNGEFTFDTKRQFEALKEQFDKEKREGRASAKAVNQKPLSDEEVADAAKSLAAKFGGKLF